MIKKQRTVKDEAIRQIFNFGDWDVIEIYPRKDMIFFKKFREVPEPTREDVMELWKKIPQNMNHLVERLLELNQNEKGVLSPQRAYRVLSELLNLKQNDVEWNEIRKAVEKALNKGIGSVKYIAKVLEAKNEKEGKRHESL